MIWEDNSVSTFYFGSTKHHVLNCSTPSTAPEFYEMSTGAPLCGADAEWDNEFRQKDNGTFFGFMEEASKTTNRDRGKTNQSKTTKKSL